MEDIEFEYIGENEALEESAELNEDFERRTVRINPKHMKEHIHLDHQIIRV